MTLFKMVLFAAVNFIVSYNNMLVSLFDGSSYDKIYITMEANAAYFDQYSAKAFVFFRPHKILVVPLFELCSPAFG